MKNIAADAYTDPPSQRAAMAEARARAERELEAGAAPEFLLWTDNFEADNFDLEEVCKVVVDHARQQEGLEAFALQLEHLEAAIEEQGADGGIASAVVGVAEAAEPPLRLSKPALARLLARYALEHPEREGKRRPILELAEHLYHLTVASRRAAGDFRE